MNILIVDAVSEVRRKLIKYLQLEEKFHFVFETQNVKEAQRIMGTIKIDVILFDIQLPDKSGLDLMLMRHKLLYKPVMIVCSNYGWPQYLNAYDNLSVDYFFDKSTELLELKLFIKNLVDKSDDYSRVVSHNQNYN